MTMPDLWKTFLAAAVGALASLAVGALVGVPAWVRSRWEARQRQEQLLGRIDGISEQIGKVTEAQHVAMRQQLAHSAEKYLTRGWWTEEERKAWWEMYNAYDALGQNGFMLAYWEQLTKLPGRSIDDVAAKGFE